ncbi:MAG: hypothetical protein IT441_00345 [Phycisphaeraceae bacterium]|nr:hypothetical protein [Phycisphaeraceae bacterium]
MDRGRLHWVVVTLGVFWFGVFLPAHQRGAVQLPGPKPAAIAPGAAECTSQMTGLPSCCRPRPVESSPTSGRGRPMPTRSCAVCHLSELTVPPPPLVIPPHRLALLLVLPVERSHAPDRLGPCVTYLGRAPPLAI